MRYFPCSRRTASSGSAAMAHLGVLDGDTALRRNTLPDANCPVFSCFQILVPNLHDRIEVGAKWLLDDIVQMVVHPLLQRGDLPLQHLDGQRLLFRWRHAVLWTPRASRPPSWPPTGQAPRSAPAAPGPSRAQPCALETPAARLARMRARPRPCNPAPSASAGPPPRAPPLQIPAGRVQKTVRQAKR